jgi:hypothetical protein
MEIGRWRRQCAIARDSARRLYDLAAGRTSNPCSDRAAIGVGPKQKETLDSNELERAARAAMA